MTVPDPIAGPKDYLNRLASRHLSCAPAERPAAEEGICLAYRAAGLAPPERVEWCGGPVEIAAQLASVSADAVIGANVQAELHHHLQEKISLLSEIYCDETITVAIRLAHQADGHAEADAYEKCKLTSAAINRTVGAAVNDCLSRVRVRARHAVLRLRGQPRLLPRWGFEEIAIGPRQFASLAVYQYLHDVQSWKDLTGPLSGLWGVGAAAGWIVPHARVCWVSERPSVLRTDASGRLHCADGPALVYRDGWSAYAWKGAQVFDWMIEQPERITSSAIGETFEPVLRNCMIEIMTPERFVKSGVPSRVSEDECGILWRKMWGYRGATIGSWAAVEVTNGTPEPDGSRKRYFLRVPSRVRSAREAVAWTYGLSAREYAQLEVRT
jgi:hypothetical protein